MPSPLIPITRNQFIANLSQARQVHVTQLPPWAQSGVTSGWIHPQFNEGLALIFDLSRIGLAQMMPVVEEIIEEAYGAIKAWIQGKFWASEEDVADLVEEWAEENWCGDVWAEE